MDFFNYYFHSEIYKVRPPEGGVVMFDPGSSATPIVSDRSGVGVLKNVGDEETPSPQTLAVGSVSITFRSLFHRWDAVWSPPRTSCSLSLFIVTDSLDAQYGQFQTWFDDKSPSSWAFLCLFVFFFFFLTNMSFTTEMIWAQRVCFSHICIKNRKCSCFRVRK